MEQFQLENRLSIRFWFYSEPATATLDVVTLILRTRHGQLTYRAKDNFNCSMPNTTLRDCKGLITAAITSD